MGDWMESTLKDAEFASRKGDADLKKRYDVCANLADVFDDTRIKIWESLRLYEAACEKIDDELRKRAIGILELQRTKIGELYHRALEKGAPRISDVESWVKKVRDHIGRLIDLMSAWENPEIVEEEQWKVETEQFNMQHKTLLKCMGVKIDPSDPPEKGGEKGEKKEEKRMAEISVEAIKGIIRTAAVKYNIFPPAEEIESFTVFLKDRIDKEKPEDPFEYTEEEVDRWFRDNRLRWAREVRPQRIRSVIRKLTVAFKTRAFHSIRPEELKLAREYIEIVPELDELKHAILEALEEPPRTRKGTEDLLRVLENVHFRVIAETLEIADRVEEGIRRLKEAMEELAKPVRRVKPEVSARLLLAKLKRRTPAEEEMKIVLENINKISPAIKRKLAEAVEWVKANPPSEKAKIVYGRWKEVVESPEFKRLAEVVG